MNKQKRYWLIGLKIGFAAPFLLLAIGSILLMLNEGTLNGQNIIIDFLTTFAFIFFFGLPITMGVFILTSLIGIAIGELYGAFKK